MFAIVIAGAGIPLVASNGVAAVAPNTTVVVRKTVVGTGTGTSAVTMTCTTIPPVVFNFDTAGKPTTVTGADGGTTTSIVGGAWQLTFNSTVTGDTCHFAETATGGATSTSWTCTSAATPIPIPTAAVVTQEECSAASGTGTGPVEVAYQASTAVSAQSSDVTFTNTFVAPPSVPPPAPPAAAPAVVSAPTFTG
jgi:hypothetical protein